jgi:putative heme-binding domain-containing protein
LLFDRHHKAEVEPLRELVKGGKTAQGRVAALWSLHGLGHGNNQLATVHEPTPEIAKSSDVQTWPWQESHLGSLLETQLNDAIRDDPSHHVRAAGFQLKAEFLEKRPTFWKRFTDDILVTNSHQQPAGTSAPLWAAFALGEAGPVSYYPERLTYLLLKHGKDPWLAHAIEASAFRLGPAQSLMAFSLPADMANPSSWNTLIRHLASAAVDSKEIEQLIAFFGNEASRLNDEKSKALVTATSLEEVLIGFAQGLSRKGKSFTDIKWPTAATEWLHQRLRKAKSHLQDPARSSQERLNCVPLLVLDSPDSARPFLTQLLQPAQPPDLQHAALEALGSYREPAVADVLIDAWPKLTPTLRDKTTTLLLSRTDRIAKLLDAIEAKKISPAQLSIAAKATLGRQKSPALAARIAQLIGDSSSTNRTEVINTYLVAMGLKERRLLAVADGKMPSLLAPDPARGAKIYENACRVCHKFADQGNDVGPHLGTIKGWTAEQLVTNILDPNREVSPNFALYLVETHDGRTLSGLIASETAGNLTLKRADGGTDTVLRSEIKSLTSPGISLMPEGLEAAITPQQMADLIQYLKAP